MGLDVFAGCEYVAVLRSDAKRFLNNVIVTRTSAGAFIFLSAITGNSVEEEIGATLPTADGIQLDRRNVTTFPPENRVRIHVSVCVCKCTYLFRSLSSRLGSKKYDFRVARRTIPRKWTRHATPVVDAERHSRTCC